MAGDRSEPKKGDQPFELELINAAPIDSAGPQDERTETPSVGVRNLGPMTLLAAAVVIGGLWLLARSSDSGDQALPAPGGEARALPSTTEPPADDEVAAAGTSTVVDQFMLGQPTGYHLFYGGDDPLQRLDLDTGRLDVFDLEATPVLVVGETLVVHQASSGLVGWMSVDELGQQVQTWRRGSVARGPDGLLWVLDPDAEPDLGEADVAGEAEGAGQWELIDTDLDRVLERRPAGLIDWTDATPPAEIAWSRPSPELRARAAVDGLLLTHGTVIDSSATHDVALIARCSAPGVCEATWIDALSGAEVDLPQPAADPAPQWASIIGGGRWVITIDRELGVELLELGSGRRIERSLSARATVSPDGRWLAEWFGNTVVISDLDPERAVPVVATLTAFDRQSGGGLLFVEN